MTRKNSGEVGMTDKEKALEVIKNFKGFINGDWRYASDAAMVWHDFWQKIKPHIDTIEEALQSPEVTGDVLDQHLKESDDDEILFRYNKADTGVCKDVTFGDFKTLIKAAQDHDIMRRQRDDAINANQHKINDCEVENEALKARVAELEKLVVIKNAKVPEEHADLDDGNSMDKYTTDFNSETVTMSKEDFEDIKYALDDAHDFVDCDKSHRKSEIATYAERVCKQIKEALALLGER